MSEKIQLLDCTLRDGAYIVDANFGTPAIKGILKRMQDANVDIIECGWLKNSEHREGTSYYHVPSDVEQYLPAKNSHSVYVAMIDWDRYDLDSLPPYDGRSIDAIRVVFPQAKFKEGTALCPLIQEKGYKVYLQAANTLGYSDLELIRLAEEVNKVHPVALSVVDTFGAMSGEDLAHIVSMLDRHLDKSIKLGFHSHNNQQLSFALSMQFIELLQGLGREVVVDSSLCGMGRGAGNATTELMVQYLNRKCQGNYDMNTIMDAIDMYMGYFLENYTWGYSTAYFISGIYGAHVNNIAYLLRSHRTSYRDMRNIIESLSQNERRSYDYGLLEQKYIDYQNKIIDDEKALAVLEEEFLGRNVLLVFPGRSIIDSKPEIDRYIAENDPVVIGVNAINARYRYDLVFFSNTVRYDYANEIHPEMLEDSRIIVTSNVKTTAGENELVVNFNLLVKRGWEHFDNSGIMCLRLLNRVHVQNVALAGFDGFEDAYSESYADISLPHISPGKKWSELNEEIRDMFCDFRKATSTSMDIRFLTKSKYEDWRGIR